MKKLVLSVSVIILFALYSLFQKKIAQGSASMETADSNVRGLSTANPGTVSTLTTPGQVSSLTMTPTSKESSVTTTPTSSSLYKDGVYVGQVADAFYGNIQVEATIRNGKIADVIFLQYPNDRSTSIYINTQAMPYLKEEAISAQNSNVDIISGATASSQAYVASLESALSQAR